MAAGLTWSGDIPDEKREYVAAWLKKDWRALRDSNPQPPDPKSDSKGVTVLVGDPYYYVLFMESGFQDLPLFVLVRPVYGCLLYKNYTVRRGWGTPSFLFRWDPKKVLACMYRHTILG